MGKHSEGTVKGLFCAKRSENCGHAKYRENCVPSPKKWEKYYFWQKGSEGFYEKKFEAHHLLCVAAVTEHVAGARGIQLIVKQTEYCVNKKPNMYAMPIWGHTLKYYCNIEDKRKLLITTRIDKKVSRSPPFKNIPQHDSDHPKFKTEIDTALKKVVKQIKSQRDKAHEVRAKEMADRLRKLSRNFKKKLDKRGSNRPGDEKGTHNAWKKGANEPDSDWYLPFSMAKDKEATKRRFPTSDISRGNIRHKINRLVSAFRGAG